MSMKVGGELNLKPRSLENNTPIAPTYPTSQEVEPEKSNAAKWMLGLTATAAIVIGGLALAKKGKLGESAEKFAKKLLGDSTDSPKKKTPETNSKQSSGETPDPNNKKISDDEQLQTPDPNNKKISDEETVHLKEEEKTPDFSDDIISDDINPKEKPIESTPSVKSNPPVEPNPKPVHDIGNNPSAHNSQKPNAAVENLEPVNPPINEPPQPKSNVTEALTRTAREELTAALQGLPEENQNLIKMIFDNPNISQDEFIKECKKFNIDTPSNDRKDLVVMLKNGDWIYFSNKEVFSININNSSRHDFSTAISFPYAYYFKKGVLDFVCIKPSMKSNYNIFKGYESQGKINFYDMSSQLKDLPMNSKCLDYFPTDHIVACYISPEEKFFNNAIEKFNAKKYSENTATIKETLTSIKKELEELI